MPPERDSDGAPETGEGSVVGRVTSAVGHAVGNAVGSAVGAAVKGWGERPGARVRRLRRLAREALPQLYEVHPEARLANPREVGLRTISTDDIRGSAVGGATQRGADFLPLKPFRSVNWAGRWQRIRGAMDRLAVLPPIDVVRYGDGFWVLDGHNRVAAALYTGQVEIDANVTELVPPGANPSERSTDLAAALEESRALRTAGAGRHTLSASDHEHAHHDPAAGDDAEGRRADER